MIGMFEFLPRFWNYVQDVEFWISFWKWVLLLGSAGFGILLLYTLIHGAIDIRNLLRTLRKLRDENTEESTH